MTPLEILKQGMKTFEDRGTNYGDPHELFQKIASLFRLLTGKEFDAQDVALLMILMKLSREQVASQPDNALDGTVYMAIYGSLCGK